MKKTKMVCIWNANQSLSLSIVLTNLIWSLCQSRLRGDKLKKENWLIQSKDSIKRLCQPRLHQHRLFTLKMQKMSGPLLILTRSYVK